MRRQNREGRGEQRHRLRGCIDCKRYCCTGYNTGTTQSRARSLPIGSRRPPAGHQTRDQLDLNAKQEGGASTPLFKVLQTNACRYACRYCHTSFAICHKRTTFKPDELSTTFVSLRTIGRLLSILVCQLSSVEGNGAHPWKFSRGAQLRSSEVYGIFVCVSPSAAT
jgi:hypothetical protein